MRAVTRGRAPGRARALTAAMVTVGLLAACSSDSDPSATSAAATTISMATTVPTDDTVTVPGGEPEAPTTAASTQSEASDSSLDTSNDVPASTGPVDPGMTLDPDRVSDPPSMTDAPTSTTSAPEPAFGPYTSAVYSDPAHWVCRGDMDDVCDDSYPLTRIAADGQPTAVPYVVAEDPPVDCFYVYPTSSGDGTFNSDLTADSEIGVTSYQAARFNQVCTMYAPTYRSVTIAGLFGTAEGNFADGWNTAYADVLDAWRTYLANDNGVRPVVLVGHSQGSFHLTRLLREEIDPSAAQRNLVVSAILAGASFQVAPGSDVGGDTQDMPLCRRDDQFGCVITYQTYRDSVPPLPGALFGAPSGSTASACTNPAALAGGPGGLASSFGAGDWMLGDAALRARVTTNLVDLPGLLTSECKVTAEGYSYLAVSVNADPTDPRADDIPGDGSPNWGLHTIDLNVAQESLIEVVRHQSAAYLATHE